MPVNWGLEIVKWRYQIKDMNALGFKDSVLSVLAGISTGVLTPNRIGNFIGRKLYFDDNLRAKATIHTLLSNMAQFTATMIMGLFGLMLFSKQIFHGNLVILYIIGICLLVLALVLFYRPLVLHRPISKWNSEYGQAILEVQKNSEIKATIVLSLSMLRYLVFLVQYYLLLLMFNYNGVLHETLAAIAVVFLITTMVPSFLFGKLFVREASALFVLTAVGVEVPVVLLTIFLLWMVNLAIPSLIGAYILIRK